MAMARILIVEDEPIVALNYASIFGRSGLRDFGSCGTIRRAFVAIESEHIDGPFWISTSVAFQSIRSSWPCNGSVCHTSS
jgi:hypothetical protein